MLYGFLNLSFWGYVLAILVLTQITIAASTLYLHRNQSHNAIWLHPLVSHFFRFWLWFTTGMITAEWVAIHRKHHANTDLEGDPHSPVVFGLAKVLGYGAELYREAAKDKDLLKKYAHGTPDDWIEKNLYSRFPSKGIMLLFVTYILLFGIPGITLWGLHMLWIPLHAAGIINGLGHALGYRNFESNDASTNIIPWGLWIGGEELHNNHHAFASSAKFSVKWWEIDLGWFYIRMLSFLGLARVNKLPPKMAVVPDKSHVDLETVKAIIQNRLAILANYYRQVSKPILKQEKKTFIQDKNHRKLFKHAKRLFKLQETMLSCKSKEKLQTLLAQNPQLYLVYQYKKGLQNVWLKAATSQKELIEALQHWCKQAEESGLELLQQFVQQMKTFVVQPHSS